MENCTPGVAPLHHGCTVSYKEKAKAQPNIWGSFGRDCVKVVIDAFSCIPDTFGLYLQSKQDIVLFIEDQIVYFTDKPPF